MKTPGFFFYLAAVKNLKAVDAAKSVFFASLAVNIKHVNAVKHF